MVSVFTFSVFWPVQSGMSRCCYDSLSIHLYGNFSLMSCNLTHWGRDKMDAISQTTFWSALSWMKMFEFRLKFHWSLFLRVQLTIFQHWFRLWLGAVQATSHYLNQWWLDYRRIYASLGLNELIQKPNWWGMGRPMMALPFLWQLLVVIAEHEMINIR